MSTNALGTTWDDAAWKVIHNNAGANNVAELDALTDAELSQVLTKWSYQGKSGSNLGWWLTPAIAFFSNTANMPVARYMYRQNGGIPLYGAGYTNWPVIDLGFYIEAYYRTQFPIPAANQANCPQIQTVMNGVNNEIASVDKRHLPGGDLSDYASYGAYSTALQNILSDLNILNTNLDCTDYIASAQDAQTLAVVQSLGTSTASTGSGSTQTATNNVLVYVLIGIGVLLAVGAVIIIFRHPKPPKD